VRMRAAVRVSVCAGAGDAGEALRGPGEVLRLPGREVVTVLGYDNWGPHVVSREHVSEKEDMGGGVAERLGTPGKN
jgi:hypothetical protein